MDSVDMEFLRARFPVDRVWPQSRHFPHTAGHFTALSLVLSPVWNGWCVSGGGGAMGMREEEREGKLPGIKQIKGSCTENPELSKTGSLFEARQSSGAV